MKTIADVKRDNESHGLKFFDKDTMKFFGSKVENRLFKNNTFVTSENNFDKTERFYTVRQYDWEKHNVKTLGGFQVFRTLEAAKEYAKDYKE